MDAWDTYFVMLEIWVIDGLEFQMWPWFDHLGWWGILGIVMWVLILQESVHAIMKRMQQSKVMHCNSYFSL